MFVIIVDYFNASAVGLITAVADLQVVDENVRRPDVNCWDPDVFQTFVVAGVPSQVLVNPSLRNKPTADQRRWNDFNITGANIL